MLDVRHRQQGAKSRMMFGFAKHTCWMQASDQAALKALTSRASAEETPNGESSDSRSTKNMKDLFGSASAVAQQEGTTSHVISFLSFPALGESPPSRGILENLVALQSAEFILETVLKWRYDWQWLMRLVFVEYLLGVSSSVDY